MMITVVIVVIQYRVEFNEVVREGDTGCFIVGTALMCSRVCHSKESWQEQKMPEAHSATDKIGKT